MASAQAYTEWRSSNLPATLWTGPSTPGVSSILPDGCMDLIWDGERVMVAGPDATATPYVRDRPAQLVAVRFDPGVAPSLLGVPASEFTDQRTDLGATWSEAAHRRWCETLAEAASPAACLEALARPHLAAAEVPRWVSPVVEMLDGGSSVADVADRVGYSSRHLSRISRERFGYGPKVLARILRLQRVLPLLRAGEDLSRAAAAAGYADYSHLFRDVRELTGDVPAAFQPAEAA